MRSASDTAPKALSAEAAFEELKQKAHTLPLAPGVYLYSDKDGRVIYVGKARVLRNRVSQYFQSSNTNPKVRAMVAHARSLNYIVTASEYEALVLECSLIKQYQPCYNILLKDSSGRCFIRVDLHEAYPRFEIVSKIDPDKASYFGPYFSRDLARSVLDALRAAFRLPVCSRVFPRDIGRERPCLHYQMKQCYGPCRPDAPQSVYHDLMEQSAMILSGKTGELETQLRTEMEAAADALAFEKAAELRDRIAALAILGRKQKVVTDSRGRVDACGLYIGELRAGASVLSINNGAITGQQISMINRASFDPAELYASFLKQYYAQCDDIPERILITTEFEDAPLLSDWLSEKRGGRVRIEVPKRGLNRQLLDMAENNAKTEVLRTTKRADKLSRAMTELAALTGSETPYRRMEAFDISNLGNSAIVASNVVFIDGRPDKNSYRRYAIRGKDMQDDYFAMREVITRRFTRETGETVPDLVLIDGGAAHVSAAVQAMQALPEPLQRTVPMFGMVKDEHHRTRALVDPDGRELNLSSLPVCFAFISSVQDEAHRFALNYHNTRAKNEAFQSELDRIPGVGQARRTALLRTFRSVAAIREATMEQLLRVVPRPAAEAVYAHFHTDNKLPDGSLSGQTE